MTDKNELPVTERERIVAAIEGITTTLRGPGVSNIERLMLNADRHDLRRELERLAES